MKNNWQIPKNIPDLKKNQVHIWRAFIPDFIVKIDKFWEILSEEEQQRARRFMFDKHRERFIVVHGILRILLGRYLQQDPRTMKFKYNAHGKPSVDSGGRTHRCALTFNMSHSHDMAIFGFAKGCEIGVDIEYIKEDMEYEDLAQRFFSICECEQLGQIPKAKRKKAFFNCWTCKEAFIKAVGEGLSFPLNQFDVYVGSNKKSLLLNVRRNKYNIKNWLLVELKVWGGYTAAAAVKSSKISVKQFNFSGGEHEIIN